MKKTARILGLIIISVIAVGLIFILVGSIFDGEPLPVDFESLGMAILGLITIISVVLTWLKTRIGVWLVLIAGILFTIFALVTAGSNHLLAVMTVGGPLIIGGLLILWGRSQNKAAINQ
jgi:hypothetical protein